MPGRALKADLLFGSNQSNHRGVIDMKHKVLLASFVSAAVLLALAHAQSTQPSDGESLAQTAKRFGMTPEQYSERIAQSAKDFGMTPEQLDKFIKREMGEPVVVDDDLVVGIARDAAGHAKTVKISTHKRSVEFNRDADEKHPGMQYIGGEVAPNAAFASATDIDGDARVDLIMLRHAMDEEHTTILLRIGDGFEPAAAVGNHQFKLSSDQKTMRFDNSAHQWVEVGK
jgi:hypothetical protein